MRATAWPRPQHCSGPVLQSLPDTHLYAGKWRQGEGGTGVLTLFTTPFLGDETEARGQGATLDKPPRFLGSVSSSFAERRWRDRIVRVGEHPGARLGHEAG